MMGMSWFRQGTQGKLAAGKATVLNRAKNLSANDNTFAIAA